MNLLTYFEKKSTSFHIFVGFTLIGLTGIIDYIAGYELAFSLFYLIPISLVTWYVNRRLGIVASFASVFVWCGADIATEHPYSHPLILIWNSLIRLSFFLIISFLLSSIRNLTEHERELSRTDSLTGAANSRLFTELAQIEIDRLQRYKHPFSLAYIDIDNFKSMNDQFGHSVGDGILRTVVISARNDLRKTDVVARLGGDEFALLLPETNQEVASAMVSRVQDNLLKTMRNRNWSITFSIGVLTCSSAPNTTDELVRMADELMYSVKLGGKNAIKFYAYSG